MSLNPLAAPKGKAKSCELCAQPAYQQCEDCRLTFYCGEECHDLDQASIHGQICEFIATLRKPPSSFGSTKERKQRAEQHMQIRQHLFEVCILEARKHFNQGACDLAIPAGQQVGVLTLAVIWPPGRCLTHCCARVCPGVLESYTLLTVNLELCPGWNLCEM